MLMKNWVTTPEDGGPQEHEPDLGGDVGPEDELARGQPDPGRDHARAEDLAQGERLGHLLVGDRGQVSRREGGRCRAGLGRPPGPPWMSLAMVPTTPFVRGCCVAGFVPRQRRPTPRLPRWPWPRAGPAPAGPR